MQLNEFEDFKLSDVIHFHKELNPNIFDGDKMKTDVRGQLLEIAQDFIEHLGVQNFEIQDVTISGSSAAYSYTKYSDIDLHIVVDLNQFSNDDVYRELFNAKKTIYNEEHDIIIGGQEVELYVQDSNQPVISLGEYSVLDDHWIRLPKKGRANLDQAATKLKFDKLLKLSEYALKSKNSAKIEKLLKTLKKYRQAGLDMKGEFGPENLAYKALRKHGIVKKLYDVLNKLHSEQLSLNENKLLDKPTMTVVELAKLHKVSKDHINQQLSKGIKIEMEHTGKYDVAKEIALDHLKEDPNYYTKLTKANLEEASGYIPSEEEKDDWRFKTALTVDVKPDSIKKNAKAFGFKVSRAGIPPLLR